jgi:uncharacterized protein (TIGR00725 family)
VSKIIVGVMGPGATASREQVEAARELGRLIAGEGWVLLTGGRAAGVMDAATHGARAAGGLTVGILPGEEAGGASEAVDILILTGMGQARNNVNVLSSRVVVACGMGAGTAAEVALALKARRPVVLLGAGPQAEALFERLGGELIQTAESPRHAIELVRGLLSEGEV